MDKRLFGIVCILLYQSHKLGATAPNTAIGLRPSFFQRLLESYATVSQFEKEEDSAECNFWIEERDVDNFEIGGSVFDDGNNNDGEIDDHLFCEAQSEKISNTDGSSKTPKFRWWKKSSTSSNVDNSNKSDGSQQSLNHDVHEEHPMRTDEWLVEVRLSPFLILPGSIRREASLLPQSFNSNDLETKNIRQRKQLMKFGKDGFVLLLEEKDDIIGHKKIEETESNVELIDGEKAKVVTSIGKWEMSANGITWTMPAALPLSMIDKRNDKNQSGVSDGETASYATHTAQTNTLLHFHADLHLSKFQNKPRMFKGTITRDRFVTLSEDIGNSMRGTGKLFRPVIGSFTAVGIGEDTLVLNYKDRGFGLSGGNG